MYISKCEACMEECPQAQGRHEAAVGRMYAMRELAKCAPYWDSLFDENEEPKITPARLRELVEADRDGRVNILPECVGKNCGTCANFNRVSGSRHGTCKVRKHPVNRYGQENKEIEFWPVQSRIACKKYISEKTELKGDQDG